MNSFRSHIVIITVNKKPAAAVIYELPQVSYIWSSQVILPCSCFSFNLPSAFRYTFEFHSCVFDQHCRVVDLVANHNRATLVIDHQPCQSRGASNQFPTSFPLSDLLPENTHTSHVVFTARALDLGQRLLRTRFLERPRLRHILRDWWRIWLRLRALRRLLLGRTGLRRCLRVGRWFMLRVRINDWGWWEWCLDLSCDRKGGGGKWESGRWWVRGLK